MEEEDGIGEISDWKENSDGVNLKSRRFTLESLNDIIRTHDNQLKLLINSINRLRDDLTYCLTEVRMVKDNYLRSYENVDLDIKLKKIEKKVAEMQDKEVIKNA